MTMISSSAATLRANKQTHMDKPVRFMSPHVTRGAVTSNGPWRDVLTSGSS
jgi:hypothetical protein